MPSTLIVYAHPNRDGHCGRFLQEVTAELERRGEPFELLDLCALGYDPVLKANEHYASGRDDVSPRNREFQETIRDAARLVFIYPVWWQNMPAVLKGFVDRVFTAGFAFRYRPSGLPEGLLKGRRAAVFTSSGAPRFFARFLAGDRALKVLVKDTLRFCRLKARGFSVGSARQLTEAGKADIAACVRRGVDYLLAGR